VSAAKRIVEGLKYPLGRGLVATSSTIARPLTPSSTCLWAYYTANVSLIRTQGSTWSTSSTRCSSGRSQGTSCSGCSRRRTGPQPRPQLRHSRIGEVLKSFHEVISLSDLRTHMRSRDSLHQEALVGRPRRSAGRGQAGPHLRETLWHAAALEGQDGHAENSRDRVRADGGAWSQVFKSIIRPIYSTARCETPSSIVHRATTSSQSLRHNSRCRVEYDYRRHPCQVKGGVWPGAASHLPP